ncbi:Crp/Fnr family transcriptional regulator [Xanthocytophaga flava]|uniref:Crp/Fnr family transcriptional regulator n=1 Tax=Xanthocytophaga flava TaxID=3048013 RepID=UPI0028D30F43|nr:Crp/Fnr family transcriptional regulator [Xanthocytophaga flavus]MDJ1471024.1 Crp/Fnr family transcriptional regulator [Xanthocytophaga flavus]
MDISSFYFTCAPIDESLREQEKTLLYANSIETRSGRGIRLFEEGTYPKGVFILKKGRVKISQSDADGWEQIIAIHGAGELFGYRPLLSGETYPVSGTTLEPCTIVFVPKKDFQRVLESSAVLSNVLLKYLSHEFTVWVNTISIMAKTTVRERLLLTILILAKKYSHVADNRLTWPIRIGLSKADLACLIGTSSETLARTLKVIKQERLITSRGRSLEISGHEQLASIEKHVSVFI